MLAYAIIGGRHGKMQEWFNWNAWKAFVRVKPYRGFESLSFRIARAPKTRKTTQKPGFLSGLLLLVQHGYNERGPVSRAPLKSAAPALSRHSIQIVSPRLYHHRALFKNVARS